eukprot:TRINITY_DN4834_c0_g1_i3.p1 TRINITY_DN4834_c0_g1~~TRINITY_DN4834_c0_g1_i3.p1  ORF type:complete len:123 (-),score=2.49 TRINITY_DN4834_c0_g1_i3:184-552(-)
MSGDIRIHLIGPLTYSLVTNMKGNCSHLVNVSAVINEISPGLAKMTWFDEELYLMGFDKKIIFKPVNENVFCIPEPVGCLSGACQTFPVDVVIAVLVCFVCIFGILLAAVIWRRKRGFYQRV